MILDRLGILTDEVSNHFDHALDWAAAQKLRHVEVRVIDGVNTVELTDDQIQSVRRRVESRGLFVSAIASPLFKCALDPARPVASGDRFGQQEQGVEDHFAMLNRVISIAHQLATTRIRIFSFWREKDPARYHDEIVRHLKRAAAVAHDHNIQLLLENEPSCNGGFAAEIATLVRAVNAPSLKALWDPGNEAYGGREAFPAGYHQLKDVLAHVHLKDATLAHDGKPHCLPLGSGDVPWIPHFRALAADNYTGLFTIETHFTPTGGTRMTGSRITLDAIRALATEAEKS